MQIRQMKRKDNQTIEHIIKRSLESVDLDIPGTAYFDPQLGNLEEFYKQQKNAMYWVVVNEQDKAIGGVGIAAFAPQEGVCELQKLYITPEAQGMGLSKRLMNTALQFAREHYSYCYLETAGKLRTANSLYTQFGFQQLDKPLNGSDHNAMDAWYIKKLS